MKHHILIAAAALSFAAPVAHALERFDTQETVVVQRVRPRPPASSSPVPQNPNATSLYLRLGEIRPVFESRGSLFTGPREAFYLPPEANGIVQLVVERKGSTACYFLKALRPGRTAGGVVQRAWLDKSGFRPKSIADEGRVQQALRNKPYYISVR